MKALDVTFGVLACPTPLSFSSLTLSLASLYPFCSIEAGFFPGLNLLLQAVGDLNMLFPVSGILFGSHFNHSLITPSSSNAPLSALSVRATSTLLHFSELNLKFISLILWLIMSIHSCTGRSTWASYTSGFVFFFFLFPKKNSFIHSFYFTILYWFCHTLTWICHEYTCVPHPEPPSHIPPHPIPLGHPSAPAPSTLSHASNLDWWFISHMIIYRFQCHPPNHPTLALSHRVPKTVLYICVSFAVSHIGWSSPSF